MTHLIVISTRNVVAMILIKVGQFVMNKNGRLHVLRSRKGELARSILIGPVNVAERIGIIVIIVLNLELNDAIREILYVVT
jgi:uncharacterized protein YaiI (UPF0178 family)